MVYEQARLLPPPDGHESLSLSSRVRDAVKGHVPTPSDVVDLMVAKLFQRRPPKPTDVLIDPGCGDGPFIEGVQRHCDARGLEPPHIIGIELDPWHLDRAQRKLERARKVTLLHVDYLSREHGSADFVIGNPPYVPITELTDAEKARYRARFASAVGRFDLYMLFLEQSLRNLKPNGRLCFITPEKFEYVASAGPLRRLLTAQTVREIHHVDEETFPGLVTYPTITTIVKRPAGPVSRTRVIGRSGTIVDVELPRNGSPWNGEMNGGGTTRHGLTLQDVSLRISCGVATGSDDVFVMPADEVPAAIRTFSRPTISGRQLAHLSDALEPKDVMLIPYDGRGRLLPEASLGGLRTFLARDDNRCALTSRTCVSGGRKRWYAFHDNVPFPALLRPKILCKDITPAPRFWADREGTIVPRHSVYYIVPRPESDFDALLGYLNSEEPHAWLRAHCQRAANGFLRLQSAVLKRLPVPQHVVGRARPDRRRAAILEVPE